MQLIGPARQRTFRVVAAAGALVAVGIAAPMAASAAPAGVSYSIGPITDVSVGCPGTGDISDAVDRTRGYVYQEFEGCDRGDGVGFARSTDGGQTFTRAEPLPRSLGGWDPWLAVAPDGTLYAAFMKTIGPRTYPIIDVSHDYGRTFTVERSLRTTQSRRQLGRRRLPRRRLERHAVRRLGLRPVQ